jgi:hypothetical protein
VTRFHVSRAGLALVLFVLACRRPDDPLTARVATRLRERDPKVQVTVKGPLHLELVTADGTHYQMHLDNLLRLCQTSPGGCEESIERSIAVAVGGQAQDAAHLTAESVRPVVKDRAWVDNVRGIAKGDASAEILSRPFVAGLFVVYAFDLPDGMRMLTRGDLAKLKLDEAQLDALALANMDKATPEIPARPLRPRSQIRLYHVGDSYEASRLVLHGRWKDLAASVDGDLVVGVPSRDYVAFTGSREDLAGLKAWAAQGAMESDHPLTATLLRWTPEGWQPLR